MIAATLKYHGKLHVFSIRSTALCFVVCLDEDFEK